MSDRHNRQYTFAELEFVRDMYPVMTAKEIALRLGRRNAKSIRNLASELGATKERKWTNAEKKVLRHQYGHADLNWLCHRLNRSRWSVLHMVRRLGLQRNKTWTAEDDKRLRQMLPTDDIYAVSAAFGVTVGSVVGRAKRLGISRVRISRRHPWKSRFMDREPRKVKT